MPTDPTGNLTDARDMIRNYERQLSDLANARHHPVWTDTGYPVLIGDLGEFGDPAIKLQITSITHPDMITAADPETGVYNEHRFSDCKVFVGRSSFPKDG